MTRVLLFLTAVAAVGQIAAPVIGFVRHRDGMIRGVQGVAGAFVLGDPVAGDVVSASSSGQYTLAKTERAVLVLKHGIITETVEAPEGPASFGFAPDGRPAWVRFGADGSCVVRKDETFEPGECPGRELAYVVDGQELELLPQHVRLKLPAPIVSVEELGPGWLAVQTAAGINAVRTEKGREAVFALPELEK